MCRFFSAADVLWAGWLRRQGRALRRVVTEIDKPVKICAGVLFTVIVISSLIFHFGVQKDGPADAFFRTISIMATGGDMHGDDLRNTPGLKVFAAALRIFGAAITAAFTAIVTNYLLRARLGSAHEAQHQVMECLGEMIWASQRSGLPPDGERYLECVRRRATR